MNDRIKELAEQALRDSTTTPLDGVYRAKGYLPHVSKTFADKFAELIVKDCINLMWTDACHVSDLAHEDFQVKSAKIKQYFGIIQ